MEQAATTCWQTLWPRKWKTGKDRPCQINSETKRIPKQTPLSKKLETQQKTEAGERRGLAILCYLSGLTDKIKRCLTTHKSTSRIKTGGQAGQSLHSYQRPCDYKVFEEDVVYFTPCRDCNKR